MNALALTLVAITLFYFFIPGIYQPSDLFVLKKDSISVTSEYIEIDYEFTVWNVTKFEWIYNPINTCLHKTNGNNSKILLVMIHSGRQYDANRRAVRETYGSIKSYMGYSIHIVFLLGQYDPSRDLSGMEVIDEDDGLVDEYRQYGDLVIGNFVDSYKNLTYKAIMGLKWASEFCFEASWVIKADDDIFLDLRNFIRTRESDLKTVNPPNFYCIRVGSTKPNREGGKWKVTWEEYPREYIPDYCYGATYAVDMDVLLRWRSVYKNVNFFWIDDVFVTGLVMEETQRVYNETFTMYLRNLWSNYSLYWSIYKKYCDNLEWDGTRNFKEIVVVNRVTGERDMKCLWNILQLQTANVTVETNKTISLRF